MNDESWERTIFRASASYSAALDAAGIVFDDAAPEDEQ